MSILAFVVAIVTAALAGGGVRQFLVVRSDRKKLDADAAKVRAEADQIESSVTTTDIGNWERLIERYEKRDVEREERTDRYRQLMMEAIEKEEQCQVALSTLRVNLANVTDEQVRTAVVADRARKEVLTLQDRLDRIEGNQKVLADKHDPTGDLAQQFGIDR